MDVVVGGPAADLLAVVGGDPQTRRLPAQGPRPRRTVQVRFLSTYLGNGGVPGQGHPDILRTCLPELRAAVALLGRSAQHREGLAAFRRLLTTTEPILAVGS
ncbi:hypothetical protein [Kitasatospora sp. NPDC058218]|uniref:hypothetical protein n=1 Tax=Kitasatospora sp. NPDC058218 TaxID=3346385 RepID=UPI0036D9E7C3